MGLQTHVGDNERSVRECQPGGPPRLLVRHTATPLSSCSQIATILNNDTKEKFTVTTKRQISLPKRPSTPVRPSAHNGALMPLALGCSFPLAATILDILGQGLPFSLGNILAVQQAQPLHWLLDLVPVAMLCLLTRKKTWVAATPLAAQQPDIRRSTTSPAADSPAQSQKAISTLQDELISVKNQLDQVRTRENTLNTLIDNANDAILMLSVDGTVTSVNRGAEGMLGWTRQEMVGHPLSNMLALPSVSQLEEYLAQILSNPSAPAMIDLEFVHSNGTGLWAEGCSSVIRDAANQPTSLVVIYRDLSHRQQQSAIHDTEPHTAIMQQQDEPYLQTDQQPQASLSPEYEVTQSGTIKMPGFMTSLAPATDSLLERETTPSKATPAFVPPLEEINLQEQEESSASVQFAFVDKELGSDIRVTPLVSMRFVLNEEPAAESQEVVAAPVQFAFVNDTESKVQRFSSAVTLLSLADTLELEMPHLSCSPFDFSEALSNIGGDENLLAELASIFLEEYLEILKNVRTAVRSNNGEALVYYAHALKGSVSNFAAGDAEGAARKLEQIGREGDLADAPKVLSELESALSRLTPALNDLVIQGAA
jgi:PAS domain S-box-containing protein